MDVSATSYTKGYWIRLYYTIGTESDSFLTFMVYDGANWLWYGDQRWVEVGANAHAFMWVGSFISPTFQTGFELHIGDDTNYAYDQGAFSAIVTGPGLPTGGVVYEHLFPETRYGIYLDPYNGVFYSIADDLVLSAIPDNAEYTFTLCSELAADLSTGSACTVLQSYTSTTMKPPVLNSALDASMFASLTTPASHNASDLNFGGLITISWSNPSNTMSAGVFLWWLTQGTAYSLGDDTAGGE